MKSEKGFQSCNLFHVYDSLSINFTWCYFIWPSSRVKSKEGNSFSLLFVTRCFLFWKVCSKTRRLRFSIKNGSIIRWQPYVTSDAQFSWKNKKNSSCLYKHVWKVHHEWRLLYQVYYSRQFIKSFLANYRFRSLLLGNGKWCYRNRTHFAPISSACTF